MDTLLVAAAAVALVLAAVMSVVAWKLLRESRERSAARVAALESLALAAESDEDQVPDPAFEFDAFDDLDSEPTWDGALHPDQYGAPLPEPTRASVPPPAALAAHAVTPRVEPAPVRRVTARRPPSRYAPIAMPEGMFNNADERGAPRRRWVALAGVAVVVMSIAGTAYAMRGSDVLSEFGLSSLRSAIGGQAQAAPLELLSLRHTTDGAGGFTITGLVQNPATGDVVDRVVAVVYLFDKQGRYFASGRAPLAPDALVPGAESPFEIAIPEAGGVGRYRVGFRFESGGVVAHVDRRGHEPGGTTGDAIDVIETNDDGRHPALAATPIGRVEGD